MPSIVSSSSVRRRRCRVVKSLRISPHTYQLERNDPVMDAAGLNGHCDHDSTTIRYNGKQAPSQLLETLVHEALHAMFWTAGLTKDVGGEEEEEKIVNKLAPRLMAFIQDNKRFITEVQG